MNLRTRVVLVAAFAILGFTAPNAAACPYDSPQSGVPQDARNNICGAWDYAASHGFDPGTPLNSTHTWGGGYVRDFNGGYFGRGAILERHGEGWAFVVGQSFWEAYTQAGGAPGPLGFPDGPHVWAGHYHDSGPKNNEYMTFEGGAINKHAAGTFATYGPIHSSWVARGGAASPIGLPTSNQGDTDRVAGNYQKFQGGNLYYHPARDTVYHVYGGILNHYQKLGYSNHPLGLPTSDRKPGGRQADYPDHDYQAFDGGVINQYNGQAYETHGAILDRWNAEGGVGGWLGLPTTDEGDTFTSPQGHTGRYSRFENGVINYVRHLDKTFTLAHAILAKYESMGFAKGYLGLPVSEVLDVDGGRRQYFEDGFIHWTAARGAMTNLGIIRQDTESAATYSSFTDEPRSAVDGPPRGPDPGGGNDRQPSPGDGTAGGSPLPESPSPFRALGDSVTAGFGFDAAGRPLGFREIIQCAKNDAAGNDCQSPTVVAYPARFAAAESVADFDNLAMSGATPEDWDSGKYGERLGNVLGDEPQLVAMTLGANPLLDSFLKGNGVKCVFTGKIRFEDRTRQCIREELAKARTVTHLAAIYERILLNQSTSLLVLRYHETEPLIDLLSSQQVDILFEELQAAIDRAVALVPDSQRSRIRVIAPPSFAQHGCRDSTPWVLLNDDCTHPNVLGHARFSEALAGAWEDDRIPRVRLRTTNQLSSRELKRGRLRVSVKASEPGLASLTITEKVRGARGSATKAAPPSPLYVSSRALSKRRRVKFRIKPSRTSLRRNVGRRGSGKLVATVALSDNAGNMAWRSKTIRLKRQKRR